ncbi:probable sugar phosphate/phosphate translocator At3g10290 isoform X2 [Sesamum indicum]|uniref:Probable sugar phosphate/phosphate translocator At3g10290 isoform X2 n=1 Tax=Sesamum indicum TaxID=4182 RepID=A0A6I9T9F7_SESIN|nr:probable sugar phosphate/phosphate translocator At3g10290 isoform X2 [Sesamum indicum]
MTTHSLASREQAIFITCLIILWYSTNIGVLLLNKFLLSNYGFAFPIFLTMCHMSACALLSYISIMFLKVVQIQRIKSRSQFLRIATLSIVFCGSVGEPSFHLYGFIMCVSATAARAFKSVLQGVLLSNEGERLNSMNLMLYMSPIAVVVLLPIVLVMEPNVLNVVVSLGMEHKFMWPLLFINSAMAYGANLCNFLVTKHTSALTLQVLGNAKGAVAVVISILLFRNPVTFIGIAGYTMTVMGVVAYGESKRRYK